MIEILARPELQRIDEDADHKPINFVASLPDQAQVTIV
jgi:hypothetical protein